MESAPWSWSTRCLFGVIVGAWGLNYLFVDVGLTGASPLWLASLRAGIGLAVTLVVVSGARAWGGLARHDRWAAVALGVPNTALFFGLWFTAAREVPPGIASVLIYTFPLWVAILSGPLLGRGLSVLGWASVGLGFGGVAVIAQVWGDLGAGVALVPTLELLLAAGSWAVGTVLFQRRFRPAAILAANAYQLAGGFLALMVVTVAVSPVPLPTFTPAVIAASLWLGCVGTAIAYAIWFTLLGRTHAAQISAYLFLVPVVALGASAWFLNERLTLVQGLGVVLVLIAIYGISRPGRVPPADPPTHVLRRGASRDSGPSGPEAVGP